MFIVLLFATVLESAVALVFTSVFPNLYFGLSVVPPIHAQHFLHYIPYALLYSTVSLVSTVLLVKVTQSLRTFINQNTQAQTVLLWISVISTIIILLAANAWIMQGDILIFSWNTFFLFTYVGASILVFIFFTRELKIKATIQQKETEQQAMSFYLHQLEEHLSGMRKFKHDYLNILNALYGFILAGDWDGLANYYTTKIEPASAIIVTDEFALENLSNIQAPEIKGILALKLMIAQNISMDIHTSVEAHEEIGAIPVDSISLVRMLGIIMDNAIEELETLGKGDLVIACFKTGNTVTFIVQNTCRPAISLRDLSQTGFTNKGEGHGLGLSNLSELAAAHPNITLQTSIADGTFTQRLIIGGE
ncbi:MAG: GHKL domain-containing protein [Oscillospiraceae bacterium]|nr:GHKL domain-containing protein [Oscillospiraceae bacterium]